MEQTTATPSAASATDIIFVLDTLPDWQSLVAAAPAGAEVVRLDGQADALAQMASHVQGRTDIGAIHIISHGAPGSLQLGTATVHAGNLGAHLAQWQALGQSLAAGGDILLYGCDVAAGAQGQAFVQALADLTGADVAASTDLTGNAAQGGNWVLESQTGAVQASTDWAQYTQFSSVLADQTINLAGAVTSGSLGSGDFTISGVRFVVSAPSGVTVTQTNGGLMFVEGAAAGDFTLTITDVGSNAQFDPSSIFVDHTSTGGHPTNGAYLSVAYGNRTTSIPLSQYTGTTTLDFRAGGSQIINQIVVIDHEHLDPDVQTKFFLKNFVVDLDATNTPGDTTAPRITSITRQSPTAATVNNDTLVYRVTFDEAVQNVDASDFTVSGTTATVIGVGAGPGGTGIYDLTVQGGDLATFNGVVALGFAGGQNIQDTSGNALTNLTPTGTNNNTYTLDNAAPTVLSVTSSTPNGSYKAGDTISIQVNFSETVTVLGGGPPQLTLETGTTDQVVNYTSGSGTSTLNFDYTVQAGDTTLDLDAISTTALALNGAFIRDAANNNAVLTLASPGAANSLGDNKAIVIDGVAPTVSGVTSSTPNGTYKVGDTIAIHVSFSENVTVTGTPQLTLETGTTDQVVNYTSGSGTSTLRFDYTVQAGDTTLDLDAISTAALALNGGTIKDAAGNNATLTLASPGAANSLGANKAIVVDGAAPSVATINRAGAAATNATSVDYTVTFSEGVTGVDGADFTATGTSGSVAGTVGNVVAHSATSYTVTVNGITGEGALRLDLNASGTGIADTAGNAIAAGFTSGQTIAIDTTPATATIAVVPAALGLGQTATVTFTFNEAVTGFDNADLGIAHGALSPVASADGGITWTGLFTPDTNTESANNLIVLTNSGVQDAAGNAGTGTTSSGNYTVDTKAPVFASATVNDKTLVLTYTEGLTLDAANPPTTLAFTVMQGATPNAVAAVAVNAAAKTVTLTLTNPVIAGDVVTVAYADPTVGNDANAIQDAAGNDAATLAATAVTNNTPAPDPGPSTPPGTTVDGVPVTTTTGPDGTTTTTIPVVPPTRPDSPGTSTPLADIPLVKAPDGHPIVSVSVPTGVGLTAEGLGSATAGAAALAELGLRIERIAGTNPELTNAGQVFFASMPPNEPLTVQILKPSIGVGYDASQPLVITGSDAAGDGKQAIILDARTLPPGTVIQVDNIDFIAVVGNVRLIGGAGQNAASGDGSAQWIVLGPDDDTIHGGGGNDTVGSEAGDDQVYGDAGDDIVFGGAGNDLLSGGTGSDRLNGGTGFDVAIQEGARTDYTVVLEGAGIKLTHTASGVSDWLVDVEQVRFATGPSLTVAHSAAEEAAAFLFQKWLGRDLNQGEGAIIQSLAGQSAEQVATLFAQLFPTQTVGKTAAQLLDGMAGAGAIRVDAVRDVLVSGDAANNTITPTLGLARYVNGGAGTDTVMIPASLAQTHIQANANGSFTLQRMTDGAMLDVTRVERVSFSDTKLALDLSGNAGQAAKLLGALAGPGILANKGIVGEVIRLLDAGATSQTIAGLGLQLLGANTPTQVAQTLWTNVTGRAGTDGELKILTDILAGGTSAAELVVMAANLDATAVRIDLVGLAAKGIEFA